VGSQGGELRTGAARAARACCQLAGGAARAGHALGTTMLTTTAAAAPTIHGLPCRLASLPCATST